MKMYKARLIEVDFCIVIIQCGFSRMLSLLRFLKMEFFLFSEENVNFLCCVNCVCHQEHCVQADASSEQSYARTNN